VKIVSRYMLVLKILIIEWDRGCAVGDETAGGRKARNCGAASLL
jgi:hypothetical protein